MRDFLATAGSNLAGAASAAIGGVIAARLLGPEGRGQLATATVWAAILSLIASLGLPPALTYFTAREPGAVGRFFHTALRLWALQSVAVMAVGWVAIELLLRPVQPAAVGTTQLYLLSIPCTLLVTVLVTLTQGLRRFRLCNALRVGFASTHALTLLAALGMDWRQAGQVITLLLLGQGAAAALALFVFVRLVRPQGHYDGGQAAQLLRYGLRSYLGSLSWLANIRLDQFIMTGLVGLTDLGVYAVAVSYATVTYPLSTAIAIVLFPRVAQDDYASARRNITRALKANLFVSGAGAVGLALLAPVLLPLLFGQAFQAAVWPAVILLAAGVALGTTSVVSDGLRGLGLPAIPSGAELTGAAITVVGLLLVLPLTGMIGAAWVSLASYSTISLILLVSLGRITRRGLDDLPRTK